MSAPSLPPLLLPPGQNADSPMTDPLRTSPVCALASVMRFDQDRVPGRGGVLLDGRNRDRPDLAAGVPATSREANRRDRQRRREPGITILALVRILESELSLK